MHPTDGVMARHYRPPLRPFFRRAFALRSAFRKKAGECCLASYSGVSLFSDFAIQYLPKLRPRFFERPVVSPLCNLARPDFRFTPPRLKD